MKLGIGKGEHGLELRLQVGHGRRRRGQNWEIGKKRRAKLEKQKRIKENGDDEEEGTEKVSVRMIVVFTHTLTYPPRAFMFC